MSLVDYKVSATFYLRDKERKHLQTMQLAEQIIYIILESAKSDCPKRIEVRQDMYRLYNQ